MIGSTTVQLAGLRYAATMDHEESVAVMFERHILGAPAEPAGEARTIEVLSVDREALLVDWLNEILFFAEVESWVAVEFDILETSSERLKASARGVPVEEPPALVKAATFHGLAVEEKDGGLQAEVIFDV